MEWGLASGFSHKLQSLHISIFFISYPNLALETGVYQHFSLMPHVYKYPFRFFCFPLSFCFFWRKRVVCKAKFSEGFKKESNYFHRDCMCNDADKMRSTVLEVAGETLCHNKKRKEPWPRTHSTWILVFLNCVTVDFTLHDSRLGWMWVVRERGQRCYLGFGLEQLSK